MNASRLGERQCQDRTQLSTCVQCFGTYDTLEEAVAAHDLGVLLCQGAAADINAPLAAYADLASLKLLPDVVVPPQVQKAVRRHCARAGVAAPAELRTLPPAPLPRGALLAAASAARGARAARSADDDVVLSESDAEEAGESGGSDGGAHGGGGGVATGGRCSRAASLAPSASPVPRFTEG